MAKKHIVMTIVLGLVARNHWHAPVFFALDRQNPTPPFHDLGLLTKKHASIMQSFGYRQQKTHSAPTFFSHR
jgi:hypothetical protein